MPSKPAKYGLKSWILADSETYYVSYVTMYTGKDTVNNRGDRGLGEHVVLQATQSVPPGRNVTTDNFFTSISLARELKKRDLTLLGTIKTWRREIPKAVRNYQGRELYSSKFLYTTSDRNPIQLVSYKTKKTRL